MPILSPLLGRPATVHGIDKGQDLCNHGVDGGGDLLIKIELGEDLHQGGVLFDGNSVFACQLNDLVRQHPGSLGRDPWGLILLGDIFQGHRFLKRPPFCFFILLIH